MVNAIQVNGQNNISIRWMEAINHKLVSNFHLREKDY